MQTPTSRSTTRRRWARFLGTGATLSRLAATAIASAAGAASTASAPMGATGSVAALSGSTMEVQNAEHRPDDGELDADHRSSPRPSPNLSAPLAAGDCVTATGTAVEEFEDHHRGALASP